MVGKLKTLSVAVRHVADFSVGDAWHVQQTVNQVGGPVIGGGGLGDGEVTLAKGGEGLSFFEGERALERSK